MREHLTRGGLAIVALLAVTAAILAAAEPSSAAAPGPRRTVDQADGGGIGVRLVDVPASAVDDPRALLYVVDHLAPGTLIHRRIEVSNTSAVTTSVSLYPAAASITDGAFVGADGHTANDLSSWTTVEPATPEIPAGRLVSATISINVPKDAAPGEKYAVVWAEARSGSVDGSGIAQINRVGIRIYLSVGPGGAPASDFTIDSLTAARTADGQPMILASVHNTGGRALDLSGTLLLADGPGGLSAGPFSVDLGTTLAIGDTGSVTIPLDDQVPAGPWDAQISLHSGLLERSMRATITFPDSGIGPAVQASPTGPGWPYLGAAGAATVLLAVLMLWRRRRQHGERQHGWTRRRTLGGAATSHAPQR